MAVQIPRPPLVVVVDETGAVLDDPAVRQLMAEIVAVGRKNGLTLPRPGGDYYHQVASLAELNGCAPCWPQHGTELAVVTPDVLTWPPGAVIQQRPDGRWFGHLDGDSYRYFHRQLPVVHEMITRAAVTPGACKHPGARD